MNQKVPFLILVTVLRKIIPIVYMKRPNFASLNCTKHLLLRHFRLIQLDDYKIQNGIRC